MIHIYREGNKVKGKFHTSINGWAANTNGWMWEFTIETCQDEPYAILLAERMQKDLSKKLEAIRRETYNEGWKDAKAKKSGKKDWFKSWW
jgi:hypothetical protein